MEEKIYRSYIEILKEELVPALGCTEPIAIAYAAAKAAEVLKESNGEEVQIAEHKTEEKAGTAERNGAKSASQTALDNCNGHLDVYCSGNIIKNVKSVTVPNSGGMRGIEAAALLGLVGGDASRKLEVLESITEEQREETRRLLEKKFCTCYLQEGVANLYIRAELRLEGHSACVTIEDKHTNIIKIEKDGVVLFEKACKAEADAGAKEQSDKRALLNVADILRFADEVRIEDIRLGVPVSINIENGVAAMALAHLNGVTDEEIKQGMASFRGVDRRFDFKIKNDRIVFLSDYAHHPSEIKQSVLSIRELYRDKKITAIFQPHLYTRTRDFYKDFAESLSLLDEVILVDIYPAREQPIPGVTSQLIYDNLRPGIEKSMCKKEEILDVLKNKKIEVLITLGAGDIENYVPAITEKLNTMD